MRETILCCFHPAPSSRSVRPDHRASVAALLKPLCELSLRAPKARRTLHCELCGQLYRVAVRSRLSRYTAPKGPFRVGADERRLHDLLRPLGQLGYAGADLVVFVGREVFP